MRMNPVRRFAVIAGLMMCVAVASSPDGMAQRTKATDDQTQPASVAPRDVRSRNFLLHTDLNDNDAQDLLERLETMLRLISTYWGQPNRKTIECYVVKDLKNWSPNAFEPVGLASLQNKVGVTRTNVRVLGNQFDANSIVYAYANRGTPQHEAVHAYCGQTFGRTGPLWYSEGMAEMGNYWKEGDASVNCSKGVVRYIHSSSPKTLNAIVNSDEVTGDSWQNYAWRWALCHLLANNPNYRQRFRPLGLAMLTGQRASFNGTYGSMAEEISFEYLFFLEHFDIGYRADLVFWDWKTKSSEPRSSRKITCSIQSKAGWQASRCRVKAGTKYEYSAAGKWQVDESAELVDADGAEDGNGRLLGAIFDRGEYKLGEPFELGAYGTFTAESDGDLVLRCRDDWHRINDGNAGKMSVQIKLEGSGDPLPDPRDNVRG
ncbi:MAG: hypothetical protein HQ518_30115 [Rhodopirellula sp.]|nr:hypothetical protein [Rhodopirellula sp.]